MSNTSTPSEVANYLYLSQLIATEILINVFGRAGYQSYYKREMVNNIGFVIFDTAKGTTRTVGVSRPSHLIAFCADIGI